MRANSIRFNKLNSRELFLGVVLAMLWGCQSGTDGDDSGSALCGNGTVDAGETCDDGNGDLTDACPDGPGGSCQAATCGDGFTQRGAETCDDGSFNSNTDAGVCRLNCQMPGCGDGVIDLAETCDDGNGILTDACPDGPSGTCVAAVCGDGHLFEGTEQCDAGAGNSDAQRDACRTDCREAHCGDGVTDTAEACDDGNGILSDSCPDGPTGTCQAATCGDGAVRTDIVDPSSILYEACDGGSSNSDTVADACRLNCRPASCGDGVIDTIEACDDGASNSDVVSDACRMTCVIAYCGDGVIDSVDACDLAVVNRNRYPVRLAESPDGHIYVSDASAGSVFVYGSDLRVTAEFKDIVSPLGVAINSEGILYIGSNDPDNLDDAVEIYSSGGEKLGRLGVAELRMPTDIAIDASDNIYVADSLLRTVKVFDKSGQWVRDIGTPDNDNGLLLEDELLFPIAVTIAYRAGHPEGELYVADQANFRVAVYTLGGALERTMGSRRELITDYQGKFAKVQSLAVDNLGRLHAVDAQMAIVQILNADTGAFIGEYGTLGQGLGELNLPLDIIITSDNRVVVANNQNNKIEVIEPNP